MPAIGLLVIRVVLGVSMIGHGYPKLMSSEKWGWLGSQMMHVGINFGFEIFGFLAGLSEALGGLLIIIGLFFRPASIVLAFTMFIATMYHVNQGDAFGQVSHALELLAVFIGLAMIGPGKYALKRS